MGGLSQSAPAWKNRTIFLPINTSNLPAAVFNVNRHQSVQIERAFKWWSYSNFTRREAPWPWKCHPPGLKSILIAFLFLWLWIKDVLIPESLIFIMSQQQKWKTVQPFCPCCAAVEKRWCSAVWRLHGRVWAVNAPGGDPLEWVNNNTTASAFF